MTKPTFRPEKVIVHLENGSRMTFLSNQATTRVRNTKPAYIKSVDRATFSRYNRKLAQYLRCPKYFASLKDLAVFIGSTSGTLRLALHKARKSSETRATVRGVTFCYVE